MLDMIEQLYCFIDEALPPRFHCNPALKPLMESLTPEQEKLFDAYCSEATRGEDEERLRLFRFLVRLGLHIP